jgi:periplasmic divalent cation tolerance protein
MTEPAVLLYITAPSEAEAENIGRMLVEEGLAACANLIPGMRSIYRWQGRIETAAETVLILKTRRSLSAGLIDRVRTLHSYECPCVVALPIEEGNSAYLTWIEEQTAPSRTGSGPGNAPISPASASDDGE